MAFSGRYSIRAIPNLRGGLNDLDDQTEISDLEMSDCENIEVSDKNIRSAAGYVNYGGMLADGPYWGGFHAVFSNGTNRLIRQRVNTLEYDDGSGTWTQCTLPTTGSPVAAVSLAQVQCSFAMLNDIVLWSNGTNNVMSSTDGITWTDRASLPKSKQLFNNGLNRILYVGQPSAPSRIDWSDINDPLTVGASSYQFIGKNTAQNIERATLTPTGGMLVNTTNLVYAISDITAGMLAVDPIGEAPCYGNTVCATENSVIWFGGDSIYEYRGGNIERISGNIDWTGRANITYGYVATAVYFNKKYRLSIPTTSGTYNSQELVIDRSLYTGKHYNPYVVTRNAREIGCYIVERRDVSNIKRNRLYFGGSRTGTANRKFGYINDIHDTGVTQGLDGVAQTCYFTTKFFTEDAPFFLKRYIKIYFDALLENDFSPTVSYRFDPNGQWVDVQSTFTTDTLSILYDDDTFGTFSEGYGFSVPGSVNEYVSLESSDGEPRGIQIKMSWSSVNDVTITSLAYQFLSNKQFQ